MRATVAQLLLLLLLSLSGALGAEGDTATGSIQVDIWAELKELRDMVVGQRAELRAAQTELQSQKTTVEDLKKENAALQCNLERETSAWKSRLAEQAAEMVSMEARLSSCESRVAAVERENTDRPRVAFSAALKNTVGPVSAWTTLLHDNVIINIGEAYSPVTGAFTAPVRGVYYLSSTGMDDRLGSDVELDIYKNGDRIMRRWTHNLYNNRGYEYASGALIIELEAGDVIDTRMPGTHRLVGNIYKPTIFSGFLLFPV